MDSNIMAIISLIVGVILLFFGYKIQRLFVLLGLFLLGFFLGGLIFSHFTSGTVLLVIKIVCGLLFTGGGFKLQKIALFVAVTYIAYYILSGYNFNFFPERLYNIFTVVGISIIIGIISVRFVKPIIILATCFFGSNLIVNNLPSLVSIPSVYLTYGFYVLVIIGALVQGKTN